MSGEHCRFLPQARTDIYEHAHYIARDSSAAADRFLDALARTCAMLAELPKSGVARSFKHPALAKIRMMRVDGFPHYLVFYLPARTGIVVVRVVHGTRDLPTLFS